jgi:DHA2 family multidrug resistance protein
VPLNTLALSTLPPHILTQGTAIRSLMRNLGGSIGISVLVSQLARNTQVVHAQRSRCLAFSRAPRWRPSSACWSKCRSCSPS